MSTATSVTQADTHILHRQLRNGLPLATGGQGAWLVGADGKRYLDGSGGAAVSCLSAILVALVLLARILPQHTAPRRHGEDGFARKS